VANEIKKPVALGLDLGGTKLLIGEVTAEGEILRSKRYPSQLYAGAQQDEIMDSVIESVDDFIKTYNLTPGKDFDAIGMGLVGRIDPFKGLWLEIEPTRVKTIPVVEILSKRYGVPAAIDNDVRCGVSAEMAFGLGKGSRNFIYMNVGTGIGAGFVVNGQKLTGDHFNGGEVGHTVPNYTSDVACPCGRLGCVEAIASGMGIEARANKLRSQYPDTKLTFKDGKVDSREVFKLADDGDALCKLLADDAVKALAETITNLIWVSDPDVFILGGGLVTDGWLLARIKQQINPGSIRFLNKGLVITQLDSDKVGLIGAGATGLLGGGLI
jgi:predicted NBD/HSP70 family sugar kinase